MEDSASKNFVVVACLAQLMECVRKKFFKQTALTFIRIHSDLTFFRYIHD